MSVSRGDIKTVVYDVTACGRGLVSWFTEGPQRFAVRRWSAVSQNSSRSATGQSVVSHGFDRRCTFFYHAVSGIPYARSQESAHMNKCWLPASLSHNNIPVFFPLSFSLSSVVRLSAALFVQPMISNTLSLTFWPHVLCVNMCPFDPITFMFLLRVILTVSWLNVIECGRVAVVGFGSVISPTVKCVSQKPLCRMSDRRFHCYEVQTDLFPLKQMPDHTSGFAFPYTHMHLDYFTL